MTLVELLITACIPTDDKERDNTKALVGYHALVGEFLVCDEGSDNMTSETPSTLGAEMMQYARNKDKGQAFQWVLIAAQNLESKSRGASR